MAARCRAGSARLVAAGVVPMVAVVAPTPVMTSPAVVALVAMMVAVVDAGRSTGGGIAPNGHPRQQSYDHGQHDPQRAETRHHPNPCRLQRP